MMFPAAVSLLLALLPSIAVSASFSRARYLMGTVCQITLEGEAAQADAAFAETARIEQMLSTWRAESELSRVNRGEIAPSPELRSLLERVLALRHSTGGAFEPRIRPLIDVWRTRQDGALPSARSIAEALAVIRSGRAPFEEGGFGKGYAIDRMLAVMDSPSVVINFGGQVAVRGQVRAAIADPQRREVPLVEVLLENESLSTSSGSEKVFTVAGRHFTHILDPRSGEALPPRGSVSVIAADAFTADVLSTALYVMGPQEGLRWADEHRVAALFITPSRQIIRSHAFGKD